MVAVPGLIPVIIPVADPAAAVPGAVDVHTPPDTASLRITVPPLWQTDKGPVMPDGVAGSGLTVTITVVAELPHPVVSV